MPDNRISSELDDIANGVEALKKSHPKLAASLTKIAAHIDLVSNSVENRSRRAATERDDYLPGEFGPEDEHQDSFEATDYHKTPIGKDSVSKAIGKNVADILSDLDLAQRTSPSEGHEVNVQAAKKDPKKPVKKVDPKTDKKSEKKSEKDDKSRKDKKPAKKKASEWPFSDISAEDIGKMAAQGRWDLVDRAVAIASGRIAETTQEIETDPDEVGSDDDLSTSDLAETGDESENPPIDESQEGGVLQFFGTFPQTESGGGPDSGHHHASRRILRQAAEAEAPVIVEDAKKQHESESGEDVERDQSLGGLANRGASKRQATVRVYRPVHVPKEMHSYWHGAAEYLARGGRLLTASGKVDYLGINTQYMRILGHLGRVASKVQATNS